MYKILKWKLHSMEKNTVVDHNLRRWRKNIEVKPEQEEEQERGGRDNTQVTPELIRCGLETYPRCFEGERDDCLKPEDKILVIILCVILIFIRNEVASPDPSSGRHLFWWFFLGVVMNMCWFHIHSPVFPCEQPHSFAERGGGDNCWCCSASKFWYSND